MITVNLVVFITILAGGITCMYKNKERGSRLREYYIQTAKNNWAGSLFPWKASWTIIIFRAIFIGLGIILITAAYPLANRTVYIVF
jgi:hypothetical protein